MVALSWAGLLICADCSSRVAVLLLPAAPPTPGQARAEEQRERMVSLRRLVREFNVYRWAGRMLLEAARVRQRERISARIGESQGVTRDAIVLK